ncbi:hypothetical protein Ancab_022592 [Ancistrocladus abbreviatus]
MQKFPRCALELVRKAKAEVIEEYMRLAANLMVTRGRPHFTTVRSYAVFDITRTGFEEVDFGWGKVVYAGPARVVRSIFSFYIPLKNNKGENGIVVPICLPALAMERGPWVKGGMVVHNYYVIGDMEGERRKGMRDRKEMKLEEKVKKMENHGITEGERSDGDKKEGGEGGKL